jgi:hypothetical protein
MPSSQPKKMRCATATDDQGQAARIRPPLLSRSVDAAVGTRKPAPRPCAIARTEPSDFDSRGDAIAVYNVAALDARRKRGRHPAPRTTLTVSAREL